MAKKEKKEEKKIVEREFVVPLAKAFERPRTKRAKKAIGIIRAFMKKHFRVSEEKVLVSNGVNELVWARGIGNCPRKIRVKAILDSGILRVLLPDEKLPEKKAEKKEKPKKEPSEEEKEIQKKKEEKKELEKEAEAVAIKRGTNK